MKNTDDSFEYLVIEQYGIFRLKKLQEITEDSFLSFLFPWIFKPKTYNGYVFVNGLYGKALHFATKEEAFNYIPKLKPILHFKKLIKG